MRSFIVEFTERLRDPRFWVVQSMIGAVTAFHYALEEYELSTGHDLGKLYVVLLYTVYMLPIIYASLNFGRAGAIPTAVWSGLLAIPNILLLHHGEDRTLEAVQLLTMIALAVVIASRVDREVRARREAQLSELKYRSLFNSAGEAILVFDSAGLIRETNAASSELLGPLNARPDILTLDNVFGEEGATCILRSAQFPGVESPDLAFRHPEREDVWLQPMCAKLDEEGVWLTILRDVTERRGLQSYAESVTIALEEERQRIATELHDVSLQSIVLLCRDLDAMQDLYGEDPEAAKEAVTDARHRAEQIADELRRFSRDLRPAILDDLGLASALKYLLNELHKHSDVRGRLRVTGAPTLLPPGAQLTVFRVAQEALRNVERHSGGSLATVDLRYSRDELRLTISDNGSGFELPARISGLATRGRLGLVGMKERARLAGGTCEIKSASGQGTRVDLRLPVSRPPAVQGGTASSKPAPSGVLPRA